MHADSVSHGRHRRPAPCCCRELAGELRAILEDAIDGGRTSLADVLALNYQEVRGPKMRALQSLFDISRVPADGFAPPKFVTAYDRIVDAAMMRPMDAVLAEEPGVTFALAFDLNVYAPAHNTAFSRDCTGDPGRDLVGNRTKRFFLDSPALTRAARMDLGVELPARQLSRSEIERHGARLRETAAAARSVLLQTYARDTGAVLTTLSVPLFVKGDGSALSRSAGIPNSFATESARPAPAPDPPRSILTVVRSRPRRRRLRPPRARPHDSDPAPRRTPRPRC